MHACGHDGHTAVVLGAALAAAAARDSWNADAGPGLKLRFLFQPSEEDSRGAKWLIEQGALEDVGAIFAIHMEPNFPAGHAGVRYGVLTASCDEVYVTITGHGGHAARPHQTRDPILAAAQLVTALYGILPRRIDARSPAVLTIAQVAAGRTHNAIPERAEMRGTLRTIDPGTRETLLERVVEVCAGVAMMTGTTVTPEFRHAIPSVVNDHRMAAALEEASTAVLGPDYVSRIDLPSLGGEDFAFYLQHVPGAMLRLGCASPGTTPRFLHSPRFDIDERCLPLGSRILLRAAAAVA
jgi:amidohydrolase